MPETVDGSPGTPRALLPLVAALRQADERYRALAAQASDGVLVVSPDGRVADASPGASALLGRPRSALLGLPFADVVQGEGALDAAAEVVSLRAGQRVNRALRLRRVAGGAIEAEASARRLGDGRIQIALRDLGERHRAAAALREGEERYERAVAASREAIVLESGGRIVFANLPWRRLLGLLPSARLAGRTLADFVHRDERPSLATETDAVAGAGPDAAIATRLVRADGSTAEVEGSASRVVYGGRPAVQLVLHETFPTTAKTPEGLFRDAVTGLTGSALVPDRLSVAIAQAYRYRTRVGVVHLDLDRFDRVEARLGRPLGDRLLRAAARRLSQCVRQGDTAARLEGHAFALVLPGLHHREDATRIGEKVLRALRKPFPFAQGPVTLTGSAGIAVFPEDGEDAPALLASAADACRRAAGAGGNRLAASEPPQVEGYDAFELEANLRAALAGSSVDESGDASGPAGLLYYQPIRAIGDGRLVGVEALLRWQHPQLGLAFPQSFLSKSDFTGLILAIGPWILRTAARQGREWQRTHEKLRVAVNLSPPELMRRALADDVRAVLVETGLPPRRLQLELPEGHVVSDLPRSLDVLHRLKALGVTLVLDRVAVRYSSLGHLAELPVDGIKLDLSFMRGHGSRTEDVSLLSTLTAVARGLKMRVAAQGVESADQLDTLRRLGCTEAQGFFLGAPMPAARFAAQLEADAAASVAAGDAADPPDAPPAVRDAAGAGV